MEVINRALMTNMIISVTVIAVTATAGAMTDADDYRSGYSYNYAWWDCEMAVKSGLQEILLTF